MKNNSYHFVGCGVIRPSVDVLSKKYGYIYDELCTLIQTYDPSHISIESQFVYKNPQSALKLGMAKGMAILAGVKNGLSIFEYTPLKAKQAVTGHGNASKEAVEKMIRILCINTIYYKNNTKRKTCQFFTELLKFLYLTQEHI